MRVLFVDDEQNLLDGLRRMLRSMRGQWEMEFALGGEAGLEALGRQEFDVVVSDMKMPRMSGAAFLKEVKELHPDAVRIVLSGQTELEETLRVTSVAHQFLVKPCDPDQLVAVIRRAQDLRSMLESPRLLRVAGGIDSLPIVPRTYHALTEALQDPDVSVDRIGDIVEGDVGVTAKLLQLVNSSFFGVATKIASAKHAVSYLGLDTVRSLVLAFEVVRSFPQLEECKNEFSIDAESRRSMCIAQVASRLVSDPGFAGSAFLGGLVLDVGKLVLAMRQGPEWVQVLRGTLESGQALDVAERRAFGVSHAEVGAYLLGIWGLPGPIVEAVANHHLPGRVSPSDFGILGPVHAASALVDEILGQRGELQGAPHNPDFGYLSSLGLAEKWEEWRCIAREELRCEEAA